MQEALAKHASAGVDLADRPIQRNERIDLLDLSGRPIASAAGNGTAQCALRLQCAQGAYLIHLEGEHTLVTTKVAWLGL